MLKQQWDCHRNNEIHLFILNGISGTLSQILLVYNLPYIFSLWRDRPTNNTTGCSSSVSFRTHFYDCNAIFMFRYIILVTLGHSKSSIAVADSLAPGWRQHVFNDDTDVGRSMRIKRSLTKCHVCRYQRLGLSVYLVLTDCLLEDAIVISSNPFSKS